MLGGKVDGKLEVFPRDSYLEHMVDLREAHTMTDNMGLYISSLKSQNWESHWVKDT